MRCVGSSMVPKQSNLITYEMEKKLWAKGILGEENPDQLRNTFGYQHATESS